MPLTLNRRQRIRSPCAPAPVRDAGIRHDCLVQRVHQRSCPGISGTDRVTETRASFLKSPPPSRPPVAGKNGFPIYVISALLAELKDKSFAALRSSADKPL